MQDLRALPGGRHGSGRGVGDRGVAGAESPQSALCIYIPLGCDFVPSLAVSPHSVLCRLMHLKCFFF